MDRLGGLFKKHDAEQNHDPITKKNLRLPGGENRKEKKKNSKIDEYRCFKTILPLELPNGRD